MKRNLLIREILKCSGTGVIECEIRLPCSHRVGSACIARWLRTNNTCPVCRRVFYPAVAGQLSIRDDQWEEENLIHEGPAAEHVTDSAEHLARSLCEELDLTQDASDLACQMAGPLGDLYPSYHAHSPRNTVAATLYIVTHFKNEHRSLEEISRISGIRVEDIRRVYRYFWPIRDELIEQQLPELEGLSGCYVHNVLDLLPPPNTDDGSTDYAADGSDLTYRTMNARLNNVRQICDRYSDALWLCKSIRSSYILVAESIPYRSPLPVAAVSLYMMSHIIGLGITISQISEVAGISEGRIRSAYRILYPLRGDFFDDDLLHDLRRHRVVQHLAWPAF